MKYSRKPIPPILLPYHDGWAFHLDWIPQHLKDEVITALARHLMDNVTAAHERNQLKRLQNPQPDDSKARA